MFKQLKQLPDLNSRYIVLDTETTGLDIKKNKLISICAVEVLDGIITGLQFNAYLQQRNYNPEEDLRSRIVHYYLHDYCTEEGVIEKNTLKNFLNFVGDSIIVAHNAVFDSRFINYNLELNNLPKIPNEQFRCTMKLAAIWVNDLSYKNVTLFELCEYFNINCNIKDFHIGIYDAFMCARIFCKILQLIELNIDPEEYNKSKRSQDYLSENISESNERINKIKSMKKDNTSMEIDLDQNFSCLNINELAKNDFSYEKLSSNNVINSFSVPKRVNKKIQKLIDSNQNKIPFQVNEINKNNINLQNIKDRMKSMLR